MQKNFIQQLLQALFIITFVCFNGSVNGMKHRNLDITVDPLPPKEIIAQIASYCQPKEKNILMRLCRAFCACLKDRALILQENLSTVSLKDKQEDIFTYAYTNNLKWMKFLLENGVDVNYKNVLGMTLFHVMSANGNVEAMELLVDHGADVNILKPHIHALHEAVYKGDEKTVKTLLRLKVDPNLALVIGAEHFITRGCSGYKVVLEIIEDKVIPLYIASSKGRAKIVELLLAAGADVNKGYNQNNGISFSEKGEPLLIKNKRYESLLDIASKNGHGNVVELLINAKAHIDSNHLYIASAKGYTEIVALLLKTRKFNTFGDKENALCGAIKNDRIEAVKLLLDAGANIHHALNIDSTIDPIIKKGDTTLQIAQKKGHIEILRLLQNQLQHEAIIKSSKITQKNKHTSKQNMPQKTKESCAIQ